MSIPMSQKVQAITITVIESGEETIYEFTLEDGNTSIEVSTEHPTLLRIQIEHPETPELSMIPYDSIQNVTATPLTANATIEEEKLKLQLD